MSLTLGFMGGDMANIVLVNFAGDELVASRDGDDVWVSVRRVCEALGIDRKNQQEKLENKSWAVGVLKTLTGPDGKNYETFCLHIDSVPMWLATIDENRVAPEVCQ